MKEWNGWAVALLSAGCLLGCQTTQEPAAAPEMSMEEMQAMMMELAAPSSGHDRLKSMAGSFAAKTKMWMVPGAPVQESEGTMTSEWILGGRFLQSKFEGTMMGMGFEGVSLLGYNNGTGNYEGVWVDSAGTVMMPRSIGTADVSGKVITFSREVDNMVPGQTETMREVMTVIDHDNHKFEMFRIGPDGSEFKTLEIQYTRNP